MTDRRSDALSRWVGEGRVGVHYWCQGCRTIHGVVIEGPGAWGFNGNYDKPTFTPSVLTRGIEYEIGPDGERDRSRPVRDADGTPRQMICHTFITDGVVQFLGDCGHEFAGQSLPLPSLPAWLRDEPEEKS